MNETIKMAAVTLISVVILCSFVPSLQGLSFQASQISTYGIVSYQSIVPRDGFCYQSAFVSFNNRSALSVANASGAINRFTSMVGKGLFVYDIAAGLDWTEGLWMCSPGSYDYATLIQQGLIRAIEITIEPMMRGYDNDSWTVQKIANGTYDSYIISIAEQAKAFGYPIFLRFGSEMNINQGSGRPSYGENATAFVLAWQRVFSIFRSEGADNVLFLWCPNWDDIGPNHWTDYYPGNQYVDWVGIDLYQFQPNSDPNTMLQIYDDYNSTKPIDICEWGANWTGQNYSDVSRAAFINNFFGAVEARPDIKMITYHYVSPFSFNPQTLPLTTNAYISRISNSRYITQPF